MEIEGAGFLQHSVQLNEPCCHHHQVGGDIVAAYALYHRPDELAHFGRAVKLNILKSLLGRLSPSASYR